MARQSWPYMLRWFSCIKTVIHLKIKCTWHRVSLQTDNHVSALPLSLTNSQTNKKPSLKCTKTNSDSIKQPKITSNYISTILNQLLLYTYTNKQRDRSSEVRQSAVNYNGRAGHRVTSLIRMSCPKRLHYNARHFSSSSVVSWAFSALCVYLTFGHHPHLLGYLCAKFRFCGDLHCGASPWRKTAYAINHSLTHLIWCHGNQSFALEKHTTPCMFNMAAVPDVAAVGEDTVNFAFLSLLSATSVTSSILRFLTPSVESCASSYVLTKLHRHFIIHFLNLYGQITQWWLEIT